jgi:hypothetical protein
MGTPGLAADLIDVTANPYGAGGTGGGIRVVSLGVAAYGPTGRFDVSGSYVTSMSLFITQSFCFDVTKGFPDSAPDNRFEVMSLSAFSSDTIKQNQVAALLINTQRLIDGAPNTNERDFAAVATGLAIWEILYETGTTGYSVSGIWGNDGDGNFFTYGDFVPYQASANAYLSKVESGEWKGETSRIRTLVSVTGNGQNQLFIAAVPEPATWAMMVFGFGLIGSVMRRSKTKASFGISDQRRRIPKFRRREQPLNRV